MKHKEAKLPMADQTGRAGLNRGASNNDFRLKYAVDAGFLSGPHPNDTPNALALDDEESGRAPSSDDSESCESAGESPRLASLAASFRVFSESLLRMERAQLEMAKAREASRLESEKRRIESEAELTRMMRQTQLQIASFVLQQSPSRKRKRVEEDHSPLLSEREGALLSSFIQCNLLF
ncbi:uncharacterized protein At4g22160-like [Juglans regia]|uniref:Uncharacterized protein At4g22160-like n=1 Tax=Juglans regia TaxID=51240 RepID=A0A2I4FD94_JUGRE|nr:uncharacterized protein At4g22160-like [Juglans regia]